MINIIDECKLPGNHIYPLGNIYNVSKGTIKILFEDKSLSSGFFLKFERNDQPFHCLMTNTHALKEERVKNKEKIIIKYDNENKELSINLNSDERIILDYQKDNNIDISIVEIISKDKIDDSFFLSPNTEIDENSIINKYIQLIQYPNGANLSKSEGKITGLLKTFPHTFFHEASTDFGSSGSPIVIRGEETVIAIHKGSVKGKMKNAGIFIGEIVKKIKEYKINGYRKEYYKDGKPKYKGKFVNDEYDDEHGEYRDEEGNIYIGNFKNGKKNGKFRVTKGNVEVSCEYKDDELINKEKSDTKEEVIKDGTNNEEDKKPESMTDNLFNNKNFWNMILQGGYHYLKPLGDDIGFTCGCGHVAKSHTELELGKWKCSECPDDDNICLVSLF